MLEDGCGKSRLQELIGPLVLFIQNRMRKRFEQAENHGTTQRLELENVYSPVGHFDLLIVKVVWDKLDCVSRNKWERSANERDIQAHRQLNVFIEDDVFYSKLLVPPRASDITEISHIKTLELLNTLTMED